MPADFENGVFSRTPAWHKLGVVVEDPFMTTEQVLRLVPELASPVVSRPLYYQSADGTFKLVPDEVANVREMDDKWLANVTHAYRIIDPRQGFEFMDELIGDACRWETAGTLRGGREIFMLAQLARESIIGGYPDERHTWYLGLTNTYDTRRSLTVALTPVRWVCTNTVQMGLNTAARTFSIAHTGDLDGKLMEARRTLHLANAHIDAFDELAADLLSRPIKRSEFRRMLDRLTVFQPKAEVETDRTIENRDYAKQAILDYFSLAPNLTETPANGTRWGAFQAACEWSDWDRTSRRSTKTGDSAQKVQLGKILSDTEMKDEALSLLARR